ncbi:MAG: dTDP-4-dehydrorhamnose 3,5-epimerase [Aurantibacter sp.]
MIFQSTSLQGAYTISLEPFQDHRGLFARTFCAEEFEKIGHRQPFVQFNHSHTNHKGALRGLHYQNPPFAEIKLIRCIHGGVYDVIVDIRKDSPTFLEHVGVELTEENMQMIYVPEGFAHGFQTLENDTQLIYHHTAYYQPSAEGGLRYDDPVLNIKWPLPITDLSKKDERFPHLGSDFSGLQLD